MIGLSPSTPIEHAVEQPGAEREHQRQQDRGDQLAVVAVGDVGDDDDRHRDPAGDREVDAALLDDQHLAEAGDGEDRGDRQHAAQRRSPRRWRARPER